MNALPVAEIWASYSDEELRAAARATLSPYWFERILVELARREREARQ